MAVLGWFAFVSFYQSPAAGLTEIEIRKDRDGAGPSHIFHLHNDVVAVVDPLDGAISAYDHAQDGALKTAQLPAGFRPWRLVRRPAGVAIVSEDEKWRIEVGRDESKWPAAFVAIAHDRRDPTYRMPTTVRTRRGLTLKARRGAGELTVRTIGPYYLASARELERVGDGRRYILWKEYYLSEPPPGQEDDQKIKVNVYVGRFENDGRLSGIASLPLPAMSRVGFDYATIMPDGTIALLASLISNGTAGPFKIYRISFATPSTDLATLQKFAGPPRRWAKPPPFSELFPFIAPADTHVLGVGEASLEVATSHAAARALPARAELRRRMDAYRDHKWILTDSNLRNPCETTIVPEIPVACRRRDRFILPPEQARSSRPAVMRGLPYDWGGTDSIERFDQKIKQGYTAGNIGGTFWLANARRVTAGVDCSGLVSNVWGFGRHIGTSELPDVTERVTTLDRLRIGDVLLAPEHHVALYREQVTLDGASLAIRVTEASSRCGSVCDSIYEIDHFNDFALRRLKTTD